MVEVSPRDGLQNEQFTIAASEKINLIDKLSNCGFSKIEATSFVSPKWVPQLADAAVVLDKIHRKKGVKYCALTPNIKGFEKAVSAGVDEVAIFTSASEGFCFRNINCTIAESLKRFFPLMIAANAADIPVRGYVSCVTDCPYDGPTPPVQVAKVAAKLIDMGCFEVSLGDTIGSGTPDSVFAMLTEVLQVISAQYLAGHFHDTELHALENIKVSLDMGVRCFDVSAGGLGGCPLCTGCKRKCCIRSRCKHAS